MGEETDYQRFEAELEQEKNKLQAITNTVPLSLSSIQNPIINGNFIINMPTSGE